MNKLFLKDFKAFSEEMTLELNNKNILLYGENGAGKSSLYEAIKYIFFQSKIENDKIPMGSTPEVREQYKSDMKSSYNNKQNNNPFVLKINNIEYENFNKDEYEVFMISSESLRIESAICLPDLIKKCYFKIDNIENLLSIFFSDIQTEVNRLLKETFKENIEIFIDNSDNYKCTIKDIRRGFTRKEGVKDFFNEAKLNLIMLLLHFLIIGLVSDSSKKRLLVFDDFISSMDMSNRTFLIDYILQTFGDNFQKIILTHNIGFYNLTMHIINKKDNKNHEWDFCNMYEIGNRHKVYQKSQIEKVSKIQQDYASGDFDLEDLGNRIRKKFEILLYEFSKLLMIGAVEETNKILDILTNEKPIYLDQKKNIYDLIDEIESDLRVNHSLQNRLKTRIGSYRKVDYGNLKYILKNLTLYQKVTMHPLSHGSIGLTPFTRKEMDESLNLLAILETKLKDSVGSNIINA